MKPKQKKLVRFLLEKNQSMPSSKIAKALDLSPRTIKNYVKDLNSENENLIYSSNMGYKINHQLAEQLLHEDKKNDALPETFCERSFFYIREILINNATVNIFELEESLFISESTIRSDISRMNKTYGNDQLKFVVKNDELQIVGEEKEKRRLTSMLIFAEMPNQYLDLSILQEHFDPDEVAQVSSSIKQVTAKTNYYLNDFAFMNLVLHILILVEAVRNGHYLVAREVSSIWLPKDKANLVNDLINELEKKFMIQMNPSEREEMHVLFQANTNFLPTKDHDKIKEVIGMDMFESIQDIISDIYYNFGIDLNKPSFVVPFSLHLSGLIARAKEDSFIKNPMLQSIKQDFPIVYMIAVFVALKIGSLTNTQIPEDECAYLALHIGSELENQKRNRSKLRTILLCPNYMGLDNKLYEQLLQNFANELTILSVVNQLNEIDQPKFDLLLTTVDIPETTAYKVLKISPIFSNSQKALLLNELTDLREYQKQQFLLDNFDKYFNKELFFLPEKAPNKIELINRMCQSLETNGVVTSTFYEHVLEREAAASTAYEEVAIPHSVHSEAAITKISIAILSEGILWDDRKIHLVLLPAISEIDRTLFFSIYEAVLSILDEPGILDRLLKATSFYDFKKILLAKQLL